MFFKLLLLPVKAFGIGLATVGLGGMAAGWIVGRISKIF